MATKSKWDKNAPPRYGTYDVKERHSPKWRAAFQATFENSSAVRAIIGTSAYTTLGITPMATDDEVKQARNRLAKIHHPDKGGDQDKFDLVQTAYKTIKEQRSRSRIRVAKAARVEAASDDVVTPTVTADPLDPTLIIPQLLTEIDEDELVNYLDCDDFGAQEKKNGRHLTLQIKNNLFAIRNKKGEASTCAPEFENDLRALHHSFLDCDILIDGEHVNDTFWVWDILEYNGHDLRNLSYQTRYEQWLKPLNFGPHIKILPLYVGKKDKVELYFKLKKEKREGIVFKRLAGAFSAGKGQDQFKFKFWAECSVIVVEGRKNKNSIGMELFNAAGEREFVGYCSCSAHPPIGSVVEIEYLYVAHVGGCLYQPSFKEIRDDVDPEECTISQLKYKPEDE